MSAAEEKDVYENWEDLDDSHLDQKLNKIIKDNKNKMTNVANASSIKMILLGEDAYRSHPPEPTVKILKRPSNGMNGTPSNGDFRPRPPIKTLEQREQEYAEARLRILGAAKGPEEGIEDSINIMQSRFDASSIDSASSRALTKNLYCNVQQEVTAKPQDVIRMPKGPDGSKGFNIRR